MNRIGIIVEGESDQEILKIIINKLGKNEEDCKIIPTNGKEKLSKRLKEYINLLETLHCDKIIILPDCDNFNKCSKDIVKKVKEIKEQRKDISIELCFATQKMESWLLGCYEEALKKAKNRQPDNVKNPVALLQEVERKIKNDRNFKYNKISDGKRIANNNELRHFRHSASFKRFEKILEDFYKFCKI